VKPAPRMRALQLTGVLLDRAVHQTFARFGIVVPVFIVADALGGLVQVAPGSWPGKFFVLLLVGMFFENRARVVTIATLTQPAPSVTVWRAALRHFATVPLTLADVLDAATPYLVLVLVAVPFTFVTRVALVRIPFPFLLAYAAGFTIVMVLASALLVCLLLVVFACAAAMLDVVLERTPVHRALASWLRRCFRLRALGSTLAAATAFAILVVGVPALLSVVIPWGTPPVRAALFATPEGIADAIAMIFVWHWRDAILEQREGRDLEALLGRAQPAIASPTATTPGTRTSQ
jgi:hypothetical protein